MRIRSESGDDKRMIAGRGARGAGAAVRDQSPFTLTI